MSNEEPIEHPTEKQPPAAAESPLEQVVDDLAPKEECADWILAQMTAGRPSESIIEEMVENGWEEDEATGLVEFVRKQTRHERGVITRDDVVRLATKRYRQSWSPSWFTAIPTLSSALRLLGGLRNLAMFKRVEQHAAPDENPRDEM